MLLDADWIGPGADFGEACPVFCKTFSLALPVRRASLAVTAIGVYEAEFNGRRVGDFVLAPGLTSYKTRLQYQTYDVTALVGGQNTLRITVGTGWYRGRISASSPEIHNTPCALLAELTLELADGSVQAIRTDCSWQLTESRIRFADLYDGETYDAAAQPGACLPVQVFDLPKSTLIPQQGETVCEHERIKPVSLIVTPKGERVLDFGQNLAGYVEFAVTAHAGERIELSHAEILDAEGNFYTENYRSAQAKLRYTCREGRQSYKPHFTFMGFRYVRLDAWPGEVKLADFTAIAIYSDMERTGHIEFASPELDRLYQNTLWSQRANFIDIPTDCPQRDERMGWTGDAQVFARTAGYHYNVLKFFRKWLADVRAEQRPDGSVPDTVPNFWRIPRASAAWGDVICVVPWQLYLLYGQKDILAENFDAMRRWVDYITHDTLDAGLWTSDTPEKHYGDWLALDAAEGSYRGATDDDLIASAFYAYSTSLAVKAGRALGRDVSAYETLHRSIVAAFRSRYAQLPTQTALVLALYFDLAADKEQTAAQLVQMLAQNGSRLQTGFVGTPYLLHALSENGYADVAYSLLLQRRYPSWLYEVEHGATTIWEHWDGINDEGRLWSRDMNSYNHYAYGSVMDWVYTVAAGIRPDEAQPGFARAILAPVPDRRLGSLAVRYDTPHGTIRSKWAYEGDTVRYELTTPVPAQIVINGQAHEAAPGSYTFVHKA